MHEPEHSKQLLAYEALHFIIANYQMYGGHESHYACSLQRGACARVWIEMLRAVFKLLCLSTVRGGEVEELHAHNWVSHETTAHYKV